MLIGCAVFFLAVPAFGDVKEARELLVGKWEMKQKVGEKEFTAQLTFDKDGKLNMKVSGGMDLSFPAKYKVIDENNLEVTATFNQETKSKTYQFKVTSDVLELTDNNGKPQKFTRVK